MQQNVSFDGLSPETPQVESYTIRPRPDAPPSPLPTGHFPKNVTSKPVVTPPAPSEKNASEASTSNFPVTPPSLFHFYSFKELSLQHIRGRHQAKFNAAATKESLLMTVEAMSSLMNHSAYDLTIPDFYWCLYWERINSYLKTPLTVSARCKNQEHLIQVAKGEILEKTLYTVTILNSTVLKEKPLDVEGLEAYVPPPELEGIPLYTTTMRDMVEISEQQDRSDWDEYSWLGDYASLLGHKDDRGVRLPLDKRIQIAAEYSPEQIEALRQYSYLVNDYGVEERIVTTCDHCKARIESEVSISASMFL